MTASRVLEQLQEEGLSLAIAESITGGALASEFVSVPGASKVFLGSIVAYDSRLKSDLLGVSPTDLSESGAVSAVVAAQMAAGVRAKLASKCGLEAARVIGLSTTGVAGPDSQDGAPVGKVFIGVSGQLAGQSVEAVFEHDFSGGRAEVRVAAVVAAIEALAELLSTGE